MSETSNDPIELHVDGMHCANCALGIENHLKRLGISDASVNFATSTVRVPSENPLGMPELRKSIESLGYSIRDGSTPVIEQWNLSRKFLVCLVFTLPLLFHMFVSWEWLHSSWVQLALTIPVFFIGFAHFGRSAFYSLKARAANMDVLIVLGTTAAFVYSLIGTLRGLGPDYNFYETAATIITAVFFGNLLEERAVKKTTSALEELSRLQRTTAKKLRGDSEDQFDEIDAADLAIGDRVLVNTGDHIPADGEIYWGDAGVDESIITGESAPVAKSRDSQVIGGTVVIDGSLRIRAAAIGADTVLAKIVRLVRDAQASKPQIQRIGDRVSEIFVPAVLGIAIFTLFASTYWAGMPFSSALMHSIAVLVVACPCAMGLATPTAIMMGLGRAAREGILVKGGDTLERLAEVKTFVFDKTGTLTTGEFVVRQIVPYYFDGEEAHALIASLERYSSHPIAKSLMRHLADAPLHEVTDVVERKGVGISGRIDGEEYKLGSALILEGASAPTHDLYLVKNDTVIAGVDIDDKPRAGAAEMIDGLQVLGAETVLLSGDRNAKCTALAQTLGINRAIGEQMPDQKLEVVQDLQRTAPVAFVGDGVNDAPSLAQASVGISLSQGTQIAIQSSQIVLLNDRIDKVLESFYIARLTLRTIKQNLFWAFFYNVLMIPVAALGFLSPTIAAFSMIFSDLVVIGNSLRLRTPAAESK